MRKSQICMYLFSDTKIFTLVASHLWIFFVEIWRVFEKVAVIYSGENISTVSYGLRLSSKPLG
jgi:hypothetical protein